MAKYQIDGISIVIADRNRQLRFSLKGVLHQYGFRKILDAGTVKNLEEIIRATSPDLILCDVNLPEGNVCKMISRIRHNQMGSNPFAAVILFIDEPTQSIVDQASEAGVDDLQVKPIIAQKIIDRVEYLIEKRKPFVVTTDYVGPDRRKSERAGTQEIPKIEVPNTLAAKATGKYDPRLVQQEIDKTLWNINAQKIERHIFQINYLVDRIVPAYRDMLINQESLGHVVKLVRVSEDVIERLEDSDFIHITDLAETLRTVARSLWESGTNPKTKDLDLLPELSSALAATVAMGANSGAVAQKIKSSVQEKYQA